MCGGTELSTGGHSVELQFLDPNRPMDALTVANTVVEVLLAASAILGNLTVLLAILADRRLHTPTNTLLVSLAMSDLLVGVGILLQLLTLTDLYWDFHTCLFLQCCIITLTGVSVLNLLAVAIERYLAIKCPFWYLANFSVTSAIALAISGWTVGVVLGLTPMYGWNAGSALTWGRDSTCSYMSVISFTQHIYLQFFGVTCVPLVLMLVIYVSIFVEVKRTSRRIASLDVGLGSNSAGSHPNSMPYTHSEVRAARKFALVIGSFVFCWFPLELQNCALVWYGCHCVPCAVVSVWLSHLNSSLNPLLYAYGNGKLRKAMRRVVCCEQRYLPRSSLTIRTTTSTSIGPNPSSTTG